jgi:hypothetical protein
MTTKQETLGNFWKLRSKTVAWTSSKAGDTYPLLKFTKGVLRQINKEWTKITIENAMISKFNDSIILICHECTFIFDDSEAGINEHRLFHNKCKR